MNQRYLHIALVCIFVFIAGVTILGIGISSFDIFLVVAGLLAMISSLTACSILCLPD